ncbi:MAG TPA: LEPR-XLL domain-containing protein, partial [Terriglobia bacterium]|nr:LEPR-XLL domain-containing protein [Terriglobia bacterium]
MWAKWTKPARNSPGRLDDPAEDRHEKRFVIEPLEPRLLLSGDPVSQLLAAGIPTTNSSADQPSAIVEQLQPNNANNSVAIEWNTTVPNDEAPSQSTNTSSALTQDLLKPIADEAMRRWSKVADVSGLNIHFQISDIAGTALGLEDGSNIWIDSDAAGKGWFVDPTPQSDSEFDNGSHVDGMDLLTVVMHEIGHVIGFDDRYDGGGDVMNGVLNPGVRRQPSSLETTDTLHSNDAEPKFLVTDIPTVAESGAPLDPNLPSANISQALTITGSNFLPTSVVTFSISNFNTGAITTQNVNPTFVSSDGTSMKVIVPDQALTATVSVDGFVSPKTLQIVPTIVDIDLTSSTFGSGS